VGDRQGLKKYINRAEKRGGPLYTIKMATEHRGKKFQTRVLCFFCKHF